MQSRCTGFETGSGVQRGFSPEGRRGAGAGRENWIEASRSQLRPCDPGALGTCDYHSACETINNRKTNRKFTRALRESQSLQTQTHRTRICTNYVSVCRQMFLLAGSFSFAVPRVAFLTSHKRDVVAAMLHAVRRQDSRSCARKRKWVIRPSSDIAPPSYEEQRIRCETGQVDPAEMQRLTSVSMAKFLTSTQEKTARHPIVFLDVRGSCTSVWRRENSAFFRRLV